MLPEDKDSAYLWDMLDAAQTVAQFTSGITIGEYLKDRKIQLAIERLLEIIGEAGNRVSSQQEKDIHTSEGPDIESTKQEDDKDDE